MQGTAFNPWSRKIPRDLEQLSPRTTTAEACVPSAYAGQPEKQLQWEAHAPQQRVALLSATRESLRSNEDPVQPKIKK